VQTLKQLFNIKQGIEPISLKAHPRSVGEPPQTGGPNRGRTFDLEKMMKDYWEEIGWDRESGKPTEETIIELGLKDVVAGRKDDLTVEAGKKGPAAPGVSAKRPKGMKPVIDKKTCVACSACVQNCPVSCLTLKRGPGRDANAYPELLDPGKCIGCWFCQEGCPVAAITMAK